MTDREFYRADGTDPMKEPPQWQQDLDAALAALAAVPPADTAPTAEELAQLKAELARVRLVNETLRAAVDNFIRLCGPWGGDEVRRLTQEVASLKAELSASGRDYEKMQSAWRADESKIESLTRGRQQWMENAAAWQKKAAELARHVEFRNVEAGSYTLEMEARLAAARAALHWFANYSYRSIPIP